MTMIAHSPSGTSNASPLEPTMSKLNTTLSSLKDNLEKNESQKSKKKLKFDQMDNFIPRMILNNSTKRIDLSAQSPSEDFLEILECSTTTKAQVSLNQLFHLKGCEVRVLLSFTSFMMSGH